MFAMCGVMSVNSSFHELHYVRDSFGMEQSRALVRFMDCRQQGRRNVVFRLAHAR
jgi:hypothetical protein